VTAVFDVAVVGAGAAGLNAADALAHAGQRVILLEANQRYGGRIITLESESRFPVELGAEFVHGKPPPTLELARKANLALEPLTDAHFSKLGGRFEPAKDPFEPLTHLLRKLEKGAPDESAKDFLDRHAVDPEARERFRQLVEGFEAAPLSEVSIQSLAIDSNSLSDDDSQFRVAGGYAMLMDHLVRSAQAAGARLQLDAPVARIHLEPERGLTLWFANERPPVRARCGIVTVPLGVLQRSAREGGIEFEPPLDALARPLELLAMGHACRISLRFTPRFGLSRLPVQAASGAFFHEATLPFETFWLRADESEVLWTAWAGGPKAQRLAQEPRERRERLALGALANLLDLDIEAVQRQLLGLHHHDFSNDARARGAYSFTRPGGTNAAHELTAPVAGRLLFAGEATDHEFPGTVAGALASGERAARQALTWLRAAGMSDPRG
jgi:monoamine oxidase